MARARGLCYVRDCPRLFSKMNLFIKTGNTQVYVSDQLCSSNDKDKIIVPPQLKDVEGKFIFWI